MAALAAAFGWPPGELLRLRAWELRYWIARAEEIGALRSRAL